MADAYVFEIEVSRVLDRFGVQLPNATRKEILAAMRKIIGDIDLQARTNIAEMFSTEHSATRPDHVHLADSLLATVRESGDLVIGAVGYDLAETPYARILDLGGVISAHDIRPRGAYALGIPMDTFLEASEAATGAYVYVYGTPERGPSTMPAYAWLTKAIVKKAGEMNNDIEYAVAKAVQETQ